MSGARPTPPWGAERPRHVVLVGLGAVGLAVARRLPPAWSVVGIDLDEGRAAALAASRPSAGFVHGDASSRLTLAKAQLDTRSVLVAASGNALVNHEAARVAAEQFGVQDCVVLADTPEAGFEAAPGTDRVSPAEAVAGRVVNRLSVEASRAVDVGLGAGEILQVTVLDGSPVVGRSIREFGARHWLVAAVYRAGSLVVPHGDTRIETGDRVLLVGDPGDLGDIAAYFRGGAPVFPAQYGAALAWADEGPPSEAAVGFAAFLGIDVVSAPADPSPPSAEPRPLRHDWIRHLSVGCVALRGRPLPWYVRLGLVRSVRHAEMIGVRRPVFVDRGEAREVRTVLLGVRSVREQREVVLAAIDIARRAGARVDALTVDGVGAAPDPTAAADLARLARLYDVDIEHRVVRGNPVGELRNAAKAADLVVLGIRPEHNSPLVPDVSVFLVHHLPCPAVFVPWTGDSGR